MVQSPIALTRCLWHFHPMSLDCRNNPQAKPCSLPFRHALTNARAPYPDCLHLTTSIILPLRTRRPLFIPGFIVRFTPPPWRLRLPTERRRRIPTELRSRRPSYRCRRTACKAITRVCRRRRRSREVFAGRRRIIGP